MQGRKPSPEEILSMDIGRPMTRSMYKKLQNPNPNPGETNPGPGEGTPSGAVRPKARNAQRNPNPREINPGPSKGTWHHKGNPNFRPNDGTPPQKEKEEINMLRSQLQQALHIQQTSHHQMVAANHKAAKYKVQLNWLQLQFDCCRKNARNTIQDLQTQLEEARRNRPESDTEENFTAQLSEAPTKGPASVTDVAGKSPISGEPDETCDTLEELSSHHAAELRVEASTQTMVAPHTDSVELKATREATLETQCEKQQEQINQLQEQLLRAQKQLEEEAEKSKEEEERARCEIAELKANLCTSEALLEENALKVQNFNQELENIKASYMELVEKQENMKDPQAQSETLKETLDTQEGKKANVKNLDGPEIQSETLQETLDTQQEKESSVNKLEGPEKIPKKKKKKKRGWLCRLFTCGCAAST